MATVLTHEQADRQPFARKGVPFRTQAGNITGLESPQSAQLVKHGLAASHVSPTRHVGPSRSSELV